MSIKAMVFLLVLCVYQLAFNSVAATHSLFSTRINLLYSIPPLFY